MHKYFLGTRLRCAWWQAGQVLEKTMSSYNFADPKKEYTLLQFQKMLVFLINSVGSIKKAFNYTVSKNYKVHS
jgi:hypothetical protein